MSDTSPADIELRARIAQLEAENDALRRGADTPPPRASLQASSPALAPVRRSGRWRPFVAVVLILFGCLLAPVAVVAGWAKVTLTDTDQFVATYAPLAKDPAVQAYVVDQAMTAINQNIDVTQLTSDAIDGIKQLGVGPRASTALDLLKGPAANGVENLMRNGVTAFVTSDAFATTWERALRLSHAQLIATMQNDPNALISAQQDGTIGIQLGPIIDDAKQALIARGITVASRIPAVDRTIPIAQSDDIPTIQLAYQGVVAAGTWLPWVALILIAAGVLVARHRARTLIWAAVGFSLGMILLLSGRVIGRAVLVTSLPPAVVPSSVSTLLYDTATVAMEDTATVALVLGLVVAIVAWFAGPFAAPRKLRGLYLEGVGNLRRVAERRGVTTGKVGSWLYAQRRVLQMLVALGAVAALLLLRPLTIREIIATLVVVLIVLIVLSIVERPPAPEGAPIALEPSDPAADSPTMPLPATTVSRMSAPTAGGSATTTTGPAAGSA